ncbi:pheromone processing carboxypeptidase-like protein Kex1 [Hyaloscypha bicolor E]|uniref:Carboxypeptidase n=1 Tax=Hyaloscypha bicolor E TaxID=1095630 RepID=A0A2J6T1T5_9HELO|nr:pheromone processing carboxypeptidase-like protein Kex1 [Hyaloscypha bicolor E]PMD56976.1 pheromone processing carboxypeptidase-like protein Kex1 [Hyaloscypha bicolor E]
MRFFTSQCNSPDRIHGTRGSRALAVCTLLSLSALIPAALADKTAADYFVHSLPGAPDGPLLKMHAGHIEITPEHNGNLFFWHYQNRHIANRQRTVIWLNGGPGCSSEDGALMEVGPYRVKDGIHGPSLEYNPGSWDEFANIMFVDNPVGTGYSFVDTDSYIHELPEMASQFITFLDKFFTLFPEYEHDDLYLAGESYAGQHIPYIAKAILDRNKAGAKHPWQLKGMLIGNGWISPEEQYMAYLSFAYERGLVQRDSDVAKRLESQQAICVNKLNENGGKDHVDIGQCEQILQEILRETQTTGPDGKSQCYNMYDVRLKDSYPSCGMNWPPDLENVTPYLRRSDVLDALHISPGKRTGWTECNGAVGGAFRASKSLPSIQLLPNLLKEVPTVLFSGAEDLICNHIGTEDLISNMQWNGGKGFELSPGTWAPRREWVFEGESAGFWQEARNLTYVLFNNSSHMVPFDYARRTRDMLDRFMGVDIGSIGGVPTDSRIDGEKGLETSVGGHPNSTAAEEAEQAKLEAAKWSAYYKSGEVVLVIVIIAAAAWGYYIWKDRRQRAGYKGLFGGETPMSLGGARESLRGGMGLESFRHKRGNRDVEAADFDESELDELRVRSPTEDIDRYSVGSASDDDEGEKPDNGHTNGKGMQGEKS